MGRPRLLLVDDSRLTRALFAHALEDAGFEVWVAGDGAEALDVWAARGVDALVADYQLPGMTGLDLLAALRALDEFVAHYHGGRNHQGLGNELIVPETRPPPCGLSMG